MAPKVHLLFLLLVGIFFQIHATSGLSINTSQFMGDIEGIIDFESYPRFSNVNGWARDTYFVQYYDAESKYVIYLYLESDYSVSNVKFYRYNQYQETIPYDISKKALDKLKYKPLGSLEPEFEKLEVEPIAKFVTNETEIVIESNISDTKGLTLNNLYNFLRFRYSYTWFYGIIPHRI